MTPLLVILGVVLALRYIAGRMMPDEPEPAATTALPPPPRRVARRRTPPRIPAPAPTPAPEADDEGPAVHPVHVEKPAPVARRLPPFAFRGRDDVRRAVVMREVLGPPLSLRR